MYISIDLSLSLSVLYCNLRYGRSDMVGVRLGMTVGQKLVIPSLEVLVWKDSSIP